MKILITGASGFIGRHLVEHAHAAGHEVTAVSRQKATVSYPTGVTELNCDLFAGEGSELPVPDVLMHLTWGSLTDYQDEAHQTIYVKRSLEFIQQQIDRGLKHVIVLGTCFEYGQHREGKLSEADEPAPDSPYSHGKNDLHQQLKRITNNDVCLQWARIFYTYGPRQQARCLLPQLEKAIANGDKVFPMSPGQQERDYIHVHDIAKQLLALANSPDKPGTYNICSGKPIKIIDLVTRRIQELGATIELDTTAYPYREGEVMSNWGDNTKITRIMQASS